MRTNNRIQGNGRNAHQRPPTPLHGARASKRNQRILITGGAGFIGTNLADHLLSSGKEVVIFDNLSRPGVENNLNYLCERHGALVHVEIGDTRDAAALETVVNTVDQVFHFAAQVAVTTSLVDPVTDFEINLRGTLNLLEAIRAAENPPSLVFTSTNKVYGELADLEFRESQTRYEPTVTRLRTQGISESRSLDFHSPYGCSKGGADQYIIDYARIYGLPAVVFRMSCIYGPHQCGTEDQGWVAHFLIKKLQDEQITIYGNGKQVRDILFVEDLVRAFVLAQASMPTLAGQAFNIGGGAANTVSLMELMKIMEQLDSRRMPIRYSDWRPGDQKYYVSDHSKFTHATGWRPKVSVQEGVQRLYHWLAEERPRMAKIIVPRKEMPNGSNARSKVSEKRSTRVA